MEELPSSGATDDSLAEAVPPAEAEAVPPPPLPASPSAREARKLEAAAQRDREVAAKQLTQRLRQALKEQTDEAKALIAANPEEAARLKESMEKTAARKQQAEANATEVEEDGAAIAAKAAELAKLLREAKHAVIYTGAGVSTAASIPDYRGPNGLWTLAQKGGTHNAPCAARASMGQSFAESLPTSGHLAIASLVKSGLVKHVISQNVDGLHMRSGVPESKLCELHGNVFYERCPTCQREYLRGFDVTGRSAYHRHGTGRYCEAAGCDKAELRDTIVYFGERIHDKRLAAAREHSEACDLAVFIGTSLKVLMHYGFIWQQPPKGQPRKRFVIINLQPTPKDKLADLRIHGKCDAVLAALLGALKLKPAKYAQSKDEVHKLGRRAATATAKEAVKAAATVEQVEEDEQQQQQQQQEEEEEEAERREAEAEAEEDEDEEGAEADGEDGGNGAPAPKRRKRGRAGSSKYKRKAQPRAFPSGPPPPAAGAKEAVATAAVPAAKKKRKAAAATNVASAGSSSSSTEAKEDEEEDDEAAVEDAVKQERPAGPAAEDAAADVAPPVPAAPRKCEAKCGFFASAGGEYCSKCHAKRAAEWSAWHGALSRKASA